jgi:hypothetical protein
MTEQIITSSISTVFIANQPVKVTIGIIERSNCSITISSENIPITECNAIFVSDQSIVITLIDKVVIASEEILITNRIIEIAKTNV